MDTRTSPEGPGEKERPRWIDAPTATSSQPDAQPQMADLHNNGDLPRAQSTADADLGNFPHNPCRGETPPSVERAPTVSGIVHQDSGWTPGAEFAWERLIVVGRQHDNGLLAQWTYDMFFGRWAQSKGMDDETDPGTAGNPLPRSPPGPAGSLWQRVPQRRKNSAARRHLDRTSGRSRGGTYARFSYMLKNQESSEEP